jgi:DNA topoisomerase-1
VNICVTTKAQAACSRAGGTGKLHGNRSIGGGTWGGTVIATRILYDLGAFETQTEAKKKVVEAIKITAEELGNTPAICRKCYVHPSVIDAYMDGSLLDFLRQHARQADKAASDKLSSSEASVLLFFCHLSTESAQ